jgi:sugar O-acyltransferase (sialic acid O-acetyltransferase NeuD family)
MSELRTVMVGAGGHGRVVADLIRLSGHLELVAVVDDDSRTHGGYLDGVEIIGSTALLERHPRAATACVVAIGDNRTRARIFNLALGLGYHLPPLVHPAAVIARGVKLPDGLTVCAGAIVNPGARLGVGVILNTGCSVDHDGEIGDHAHLHPGAVLAGGVKVGAYTFIGTNAAVNPGVTVGAKAMIGSGAVVVEDVPDGVVAYGVPALVQGEWNGC